jgi:hypothetical protein
MCRTRSPRSASRSTVRLSAARLPVKSPSSVTSCPGARSVGTSARICAIGENPSAGCVASRSRGRPSTSCGSATGGTSSRKPPPPPPPPPPPSPSPGTATRNTSEGNGNKQSHSPPTGLQPGSMTGPTAASGAGPASSSRASGPGALPSRPPGVAASGCVPPNPPPAGAPSPPSSALQALAHATRPRNTQGPNGWRRTGPPRARWASTMLRRCIEGSPKVRGRRVRDAQAGAPRG